ncbi:acylneuraminate cytidylyltransferase family protein [Pelagibacterales bacterium SAG-MED49]|nr:acylneuraminate cytidylyltransferase family protein [Pelagibacterales bacterium SAG-MED49]
MLAIIPARGGSKGLPGKNTKHLNGMPLICHSIKTALESNLIDRVILSTDDDEIASIGKNCGAEVPFMRSKDLALDTSMVMDSYLEVIDWITDHNSKKIHSFVALLPTVPLRNCEDIDNAIKIFNEKKADSVISVVEAPVPLHWYRRITEQGKLKNYSSEFDATKNRQELEKTYVPNGAIYIFRTEVLRSTREYYTDETYPYIMPRERSADIDDQLDFEWTEYLLTKDK